ncbi:MAG: hypothetical protein LBO05_07150 [Deltaproteobacteria bacterium]|jgi:hypothetical protein|nr:hypothetical protein [Deltaproteobacteria bacterium]
MNKGKKNISDLLKRVSRERLRNFISDYARRDTAFAQAVVVSFDDPDFDGEVWAILSKFTCDYGDWGYVVISNDQADFEIGRRRERGQLLLAYKQTAVLCHELLKYYEHQHECEVFDVIDKYADSLVEMAGEMTAPADRAGAFQTALRLADDKTGEEYGAEHQGKFLLSASKLLTENELPEFESVLEKLSEYFDGGVLAMIRLNVVEPISGVGGEYEKFIAGNTNFEPIRRIAYDRAMTSGDFAKAARLCLESPAEGTRFPGHGNNWPELLFLAYEAADDKPKMAEAAERLMYLNRTEYFDKLKELHVGMGDWNKFYPRLLDGCQMNCRRSVNMELLSRLGETGRLYKAVLAEPGEICVYGRQLAPEFPEETGRIFRAQIVRQASSARYHFDYFRVRGLLGAYAEAGYVDAARKLSFKLMAANTRRPAFIQELQFFESCLPKENDND